MRAFSTVKKNFIYGAPGLGDRVHSVLLSYNYALANDDSVKSVQFILDNFKKVLISNDDSSLEESTKNE